MRFNPVAAFVFLCGIMSVAIAIYAWNHRSINGARMFSIFMFSLTVYVLGYSMELASLNISTMLFWSKIQYLGILTFPPLSLIFVIQYINREKWLTRRNIVLLFVIPAVGMVFKLSDEYFHLIYRTTELDTSGSIPLLALTHGPVYMVNAAYTLLVIVAANFLVFQKRRHSSSLFRRQTTLMLVAASVIFLVYIYYLSGLQLFPSLKHLDLNPFVFTIWGIAIAWAMFRYRLFDLAPIAREALIENLSDGVVVLDAQYRVVDVNQAAQKLFGWSVPLIGQHADQLLHNWIDPSVYRHLNEPAKTEIRHDSGGVEKYYEVNTSILQDKKGLTLCYLISLHDITERKLTEEKLRELSLVDELTGLSNRRGFYILATQLIQMTQRMKLTAVLIYIDMDGLKLINDTWGHSAGDQALVDTAGILKIAFRSSDIIARLGGDEFVVLAIESNENSGSKMIERLKEQLYTHNAQENRLYKLSISIGLAHYEPGDVCSLDVLLEEADKAMYEYKQAKRVPSNLDSH
jgi:diguanylate cyclase (GGDEF)-like protein/PAS domain S-box-containing protein